jgi:hypothetical protein
MGNRRIHSSTGFLVVISLITPPTVLYNLKNQSKRQMRPPPEPYESDAPIGGVVPVERMTGDDEEDFRLLREMATKAETYISAFPWCGNVRSSWFGGGLGGVFAIFLFNISPAGPKVDSWIWIVVGDIPSAYLPLEDAKAPAEVIAIYMRGMLKWVELARQGRSGTPDEGVPPVDIPATPEWAENVEQRLHSLTLIVKPFFDDSGEPTAVN